MSVTSHILSKFNFTMTVGSEGVEKSCVLQRYKAKHGQRDAVYDGKHAL